MFNYLQIEKGLLMNRNILKALLSFIVLIGGLAAYFYWQQTEPEVAFQATPPPAIPETPKPQAQKIIEAPAVTTPLPELSDSDSFMLNALSGLVDNPSLIKLFLTEKIIRNIVATIDNLPRMKLSLKLVPLELPSGKFMTSGKEGNLSISPKNATRYTPYMKIAEAIDSRQLVALYIRLYPLFQQAYAELGYPNKYFNDRLIEALDDLLDAPDILEPVKLVRPNVLYQFADPELEELSIGQRILMRIGSKNAALMKAKLLEIRQELNLHMHEKRLGNPG